MQDKADRLSIGKAAKLLGVSIDTLRRWEKKGKASSHRSPGGHRYFLKTDLEKVFLKKYEREQNVKVQMLPENRGQDTKRRFIRSPNKFLIILLSIFFVIDIILISLYLLTIK